jgi:hypothetical protein
MQEKRHYLEFRLNLLLRERLRALTDGRLGTAPDR